MLTIDDYEHVAHFIHRPRVYIQRRTEHLEFVTDRQFQVTAMQQCVAPPHRSLVEESRDPLVAPILVGFFAKYRMPELVVRNSSGALLPVLDRDARATLTAFVYLQPQQERFFAELSAAQTAIASEVWSMLVGTVEVIATQTPNIASTHLVRRFAELNRLVANVAVDATIRARISTLIHSQDLQRSLVTLCEVAPIFALRHLADDDQVDVLEMSYSEPFVYPDPVFRELREALRESPTAVVRMLLRRFLETIGLLHTTVFRRAANSGQARSLWISVSTPPGVEALRLFWKDRSQESGGADMPAVAGDRVAIGRYLPEKIAEKEGVEDRMLLDMQLAPSPAHVTGLALTIFVALIATYTYRRLPRIVDEPAVHATLLSAIALFAAVPAGLAGGLAQLSQPLSRRMSRGVRSLMALVAAQAALLAVMIGFRDLGDGVEWASYVLSVTAVAISAILALLLVGPRWRKTDRSRIRWRTNRASPAVCRRKQWRTILILSFTAGAGVGFMAIAQYYGRAYHVTDSEFWSAAAGAIRSILPIV